MRVTDFHSRASRWAWESWSGGISCAASRPRSGRRGVTVAMTRLGGRLEIDDRLHDTALPGNRVTDDLAVVVPDHGRPIYSIVGSPFR